MAEIPNFKDKELDEQPNIKDIPQLESEKSAAQEKQSAKGLKILTPDQMLSRLPITLAQLKQEIIQKNLKMKSGNYFILRTVKKSQPKQSITI